MATLTERLRGRPDIEDPRAVARAAGKRRHGKRSISRLKARKRGLMRSRM
jgi:hypothetical protein